MASVVLPTPGGDEDVWGPKLNTAVEAINAEQETGRLSEAQLNATILALLGDLYQQIATLTEQNQTFIDQLAAQKPPK